METNYREPLLSDVEIHDTFMYGSLISDSEHGFKSGAGYARNFYEAKITSGELMVEKTARRSFNSGGGKELWQCCGECRFEPMPDSFNFCPGCGAKIVEG